MKMRILQWGFASFIVFLSSTFLAWGQTPPYIISQPTNETVIVGGTATFSVTAGGTAPLSYQWYFQTTNLVGTNATLTITDATTANVGPYYVNVENPYGSTNSHAATLRVNSPGPQVPYIILQPTNQTVMSGGTATFSVTAGGTAPLSYQWYFDETNLVGTNATLILNDVSAADAGPYYVRVSNTYGLTNSPAATLTVTSPTQAPYIIDQPTNETVAAGNGALFTVVAGGTAPLSYQWYFDETNLVGTNATLVLTNATPADAGQYQVFVSNAYGSTNSAMAILTVTSSGPPTAPYIFEQPTNETVAAGGTATFSVDVGGVAPLSYQWYYGETNLVGTNATLVLDDVTPADAGPYNVMIENAYGSTNSHAAVLTVTSSGPSQAPYIIDQPTNETVAAGDTAAFTVVAGGTAPLSYQWYFNYTNLVGTYATLVLTNATPADAGQYQVFVSNAYGSTNSATAILTVTSSGPPTAPYIFEQPTNETEAAGGTATFSVDVGGVAPLSYQWYYGETNLVGTNATLVLDDVTPADAGPYNVMIENAYGSTNSHAAILTVTSSGPSQAPYVIDQPTNETVAAGDTAAFTVVAGGSTPLSYQWYFDETNLVGTNATLILTNVAPADAGSYYAAIENAYGSTNSAAAILTVLSSSGEAPYIITQPTNETATVGGTVIFRMTAGGTAPLTYQWYSNGTNIEFATNATLIIRGVTLANAGPYYVTVENPYGSTNSATATLTVNSPPPPQAPYIIDQPTNETVTAGGTATFSVTAGGATPLSYQWYFGETNLVGTNATLVLEDVTPANAGPYNVMIENAYGSTNSHAAIFTVTSSSPGQAPYIIDQPTNETVAAGDSAMFTVIAGGTAPLSYQWYFDYTNLVGTYATLILTNATPEDAGQYQVFVSDAYGSTNSINVQLTVTSSSPGQAPYIIDEPTNETVVAGDTATFSVTAGGTAPLTYQWYSNGTNIEFATNATLIIPAVTPANAGPYYVSVENAYGLTNSATAMLTVNGSTSCDPAPSGIVAWWPAEGNTDDIIGGNNGIVTNGTVGYAPAEVGLGFNFDGGPNRLIVPDAPALNFGSNQDFSIEGWIRAFPTNNTPQGVMSILEKRLASGLNCQGYDINLTYGTFNFQMSDDYNSGGSLVAVGGPNLLDGNLHHVAVSVERDSTTGGHMYVDGIMVNEFDPTSQTGDLTTTEPLRIGNHPDPAYTAFFDGQIDELSLYNRALSSNEIVAIYQAGSEGKCPPPPPTAGAPYIITQPVNQSVIFGRDALFSVTAGGAAPLSYQWYFNGTNLVAGTNASLLVPLAGPNDAGTYYVTIANAFGSTNSDTVTLTVLNPNQLPPYIITQPTNETVTAGGTAIFNVTAGGAAPLSYQWYFGETNLVGTNATLVLNDVTPADAGPYNVMIENAYGSTNSQAGVLTVTSSSPSAVDHFTWNPIPSPRFRATPFTVTLTARDVDGAIVTNFTGTVHINLTNGMPVLPPTLGNFVYGSSTRPVFVPLPGTNLVLQATDASGHTGFSNPFNVVNLPVLTPVCCSNTFQIAWPANPSGFILEMTTNLASGNWVPVPGQPLQSSNQCLQVITPMSCTNIPAFYRLHFMGQ